MFKLFYQTVLWAATYFMIKKKKKKTNTQVIIIKIVIMIMYPLIIYPVTRINIPIGMFLLI